MTVVDAVAQAISPTREDWPVYRPEAKKGVNALLAWLVSEGHYDVHDRLAAVLNGAPVLTKLDESEGRV